MTTRICTLAGAALILASAASAQPLLRNGSFEADGSFLIGVGYTTQGNTIQAWQIDGGNFGRNTQNAGLFYDNGVAPHGRSVGFIQNPGAIHQDVPGFEAGKTYRVSFAANPRANLPDNYVGPSTFQVRMAGDIVLGPITVDAVDAQGVFATPWPTYGFDYTATADGSVNLRFEHLSGDGRTICFDNFRIWELGRETPRVANRSFEAPLRDSLPSNYSGHPAQTANQGRGEPAGWVRATDPAGQGPTDNVVRSGLAPASPFLDNGAVPDGNQVFWMQGTFDVLSQTVPGFQEGQEYDVSIRANSRNAPAEDARLELRINGDVVIDTGQMAPVGGTNPFLTFSNTFTAPSTGPMVVEIRNIQLLSDLNVDNLRIVPAAAPPELVVAPSGTIDIGRASVDEAITRTISIVNDGGTDLTVAGLDFDNPDFTVVSPATPFVVAPAGTQQVVLQFESAIAGPASATLSISSNNPVDPVEVPVAATAFDAVDVVNPSFELDALGPFPGKLTSIIGWDVSGFGPNGGGVNDQALPFWDNGAAPDGTQVGFMQGSGVIRQRIPGFKDGEQYRISIALNARTIATVPEAIVRFDGVAFDGFPQDIPPVEAAGSYTQEWPVFTQIVTIDGDGSKWFEIEQTRPNTGPEGDYTLLFDNLVIEPFDPASVGEDWTLFSY